MVVGISSCGGTESGIAGVPQGPLPGAADGGEVSASAEPSAATSAAESETPVPRSIGDPCVLLTEADRAQLTLTGEVRPGGDGDRCVWENTGTPVLSLSFDYFDDVGLDRHAQEASGAAPVETMVGQRRALKIADGSECALYIELGARSSVEIEGTVAGSPDDSARSCALAEQAAPLLAGKLP